MQDMKVSELMTVVNALNGSTKQEECSPWPWIVGKQYFIRTVTMHIVGELVAITDKELLMEHASWVADSGRFNNALKTGVLDEVEPFINDVIVNRNSVIDATWWNHALPSEVK